MSEIIVPSIGMSGEFRAILRDENMAVVYDSGWHSNRIVDNGLIICHQYTFCNRAYIGDDGTATSDLQTALTNEIGYQSSYLSTTAGPTPTAPNYERYCTYGWRFEAGNGTGTIREIGVGYTSTGNRLFARHVLGVPIPKASNQSLDVFYRLIKWPKLTATTGVTTFGGITYDYSILPLYVQYPPSVTSHNYAFAASSLEQYYRGYTGGAGAITDQNPLGSSLGQCSLVFNGAGGFSGYRDWGMFFNLAYAGSPDYVRSIKWQMLDTTVYGQITFTQQAGQPNPGEGIPKTNTEELTINMRFVSGRH